MYFRMRKRGFAACQEQEQRQQGQPEGAALAAAAAAAAVKRRVVKINKKDKKLPRMWLDMAWKKTLDDNVSCLFCSSGVFRVRWYSPSNFIAPRWRRSRNEQFWGLYYTLYGFVISTISTFPDIYIFKFRNSCHLSDVGHSYWSLKFVIPAPLNCSTLLYKFEQECHRIVRASEQKHLALFLYTPLSIHASEIDSCYDLTM